MFDGIAVDNMIDSADENDFGGAKDHGYSKEAEEEQGDSDQRIDEVEQDHAGDGQEEQAQQLDDPEAKGSADAFAPFRFHHAGGAAESGHGPYVLIGDDRNDEESSDTPCGAEEAGNDLAKESDPILDDAEDGANGSGEYGPCEDRADAAYRKPKAITDRRPLSLEVQMSAMDEGGVEEYNDKVVHYVVTKEDDVIDQSALVFQRVDRCDIPAGGCEQDYEKGRNDQDHGNTGKNGKKDQLAVLFQDGEAFHRKIPAIGKTGKKVHAKDIWLCYNIKQ